MKDERLYLLHIIEASDIIFEYAENDRQRFLNDRMRRDAIIKNLANVAESSAKLSEESKALCPDIPWAAVAAFRNILVHDYLGKLNHERVWRVIEEHLPRLQQAARKILEQKI